MIWASAGSRSGGGGLAARGGAVWGADADRLAEARLGFPAPGEEGTSVGSASSGPKMPGTGVARGRREESSGTGGALFDSMSAIENVEFPLQTFTDLNPREARRRALECLELVELPDVGKKTPGELSGGQQKRVALARAIAIEPAYILYDEPTSGLDPETGKTIDDLIDRLGRDLGTTSVVISHDMHSVLRIADHIGFLHEGRLHWRGTVDELHAATDPILLSFVRANEYQIGRPVR